MVNQLGRHLSQTKKSKTTDKLRTQEVTQCSTNLVGIIEAGARAQDEMNRKAATVQDWSFVNAEITKLN